MEAEIRLSQIDRIATAHEMGQIDSFEAIAQIKVVLAKYTDPVAPDEIDPRD